MTRHAERDALSPAKRAWIIAALFCAFVDLAFLGDALLPGRVRAAGDIVAATPPASGADPAPAPRNLWLSDWATVIHPLHRLVRRSWADGRAPLWNPRVSTGEPLAARAESEAFSPYLWAILEGGDDDADWKTFAVMFVAQASSLLLWRAFGGRVFGGLVLAFAFSFASVIQAPILFPQAGTVAFAPLLLWAFVRLHRRRNAWRFLIAAVSIAACAAAGDPEAAFITIVAVFVLALFDRDRERATGAWPPVVVMTGALLAGFLTAAPPLLLWATAARPEVAVEGTVRALPWRFLMTLISPRALGWPIDPANPWRPSISPLEGIFFAGRIVLVLVPLGLYVFRRRDPRFFAGIAAVVAVAVLVAYAPPEIAARFARLPLLGLASPRRFWIAAVLPLALAAARGADFLGDRTAEWGAKRAARAVVCVLALGIMVEGFSVWRSFVPVVGRSLLSPAAPVETELEKLRPDRGLGLGRLFAPEIAAAWETSIARSRRLPERVRALLSGRSASALDPAGGVDVDPRILDLMAVRWLVSEWPIHRTPHPAEPTLIDQGLPWSVRLDVPVGEAAEWLLVRPRHAGGAISGDVLISCSAPGIAPVVVRPRGTAGPSVSGELGRFDLVPDAAVREMIETDFAADDAVYFAFTCTFAGVTATMRYELDQDSAPVFVMPIVRGGAGPGVRETGVAAPYRFSRREQALPRAFFTSNVMFADDCDDARRLLARREFDPLKGAVIEGAERFSDRIFDTTPGVTACDLLERSAGEVRIVVNTPRAGFLCLMDDPAPGWSATLERGDDLEIFPADLCGRAVFCPAGKSVVIMRYRPWPYLLGAGLSAITAVLLTIGVLMRLGHVRTSSAPRR